MSQILKGQAVLARGVRVVLAVSGYPNTTCVSRSRPPAHPQVRRHRILEYNPQRSPAYCDRILYRYGKV